MASNRCPEEARELTQQDRHNFFADLVQDVGERVVEDCLFGVTEDVVVDDEAKFDRESKEV